MFSKSRARTLGCLFALGALVATLATACDPAPTITNVQANPSTTTAYVYWETNVASSSQVFYGPTTSYGTAAPIDTNGTTTHLYLLTGLTPGATYHYKVQSKTTTSDVGESGDYTFTTFQLPATDCQPSKGITDELCWYNSTGVENTFTADPNDRWHESDIKADNLVNGHRPSEQLSRVQGNSGGQSGVTVTNGIVRITQAGLTWSNKYVSGCISIEANNVTLNNVFLDANQTALNSQGGNGCFDPAKGGGGSTGIASWNRTGTTLTNVEVSATAAGQSDWQCAAPPWIQDACPEFKTSLGQYGMNITLEGGNSFVDRVNIHGGYVDFGYSHGARIQNSYLHDIGHMHQPCYPTCINDHSGPNADDYHNDNVWAQGVSNWSVTHSFLLSWHADWDEAGHNTGSACLCDHASSNWVFNDVYMDATQGGQGTHDLGAGVDGNPSADPHTRVVMQNVYTHRPGGGVRAPSNQYSDFSAGAWTPSFTNNIPNVTHSYCNGLFTVTDAGVKTRYAC